MTQRELRNNIFKILFEKELMLDLDIDKKIEEAISENNLENEKKIFFIDYIKGVTQNKNEIVNSINKNLKKWSYNTIGTYEKVILQMAFYEILIKKDEYQIAINEALELAKIYGDENTKPFINAVLAEIV